VTALPAQHGSDGCEPLTGGGRRRAVRRGGAQFAAAFARAGIADLLLPAEPGTASTV
jgi:hypothetical protein